MSGGDQAPIGTPFGSKGEPEEVMSEIDLTGRNAIVAGGYSGLGLETVRALISAGADENR